MSQCSSGRSKNPLALAMGSVNPSSVHECIITPISAINPNELRETVKLINGTELAVDEVLSDSIYFYLREKGVVIM